MPALVLALALVATACADVRRGEYWEDPAASTGAAGADAMDDDSAPVGSTSAADDGADAGSDAGTPGSETTTGADAISFAADVAPLLDAGCERCHASDGQASNTTFLLVGENEADYETTLEFVDLEDPESSRLLSKGAGNGHTGGVIFDDRSSEYETILQWIEQGATP